MKVDLAVIKEEEGAASGRYPTEWPQAARKVKEASGWKCERCGRTNDYENGFTLTVHHLDGDKFNLESWNLAALCQRCHLQVQNKIDFYTDNLTGVHREWMAKHVQAYNEWARVQGKHLLTLTKIIPNKSDYPFTVKMREAK